MKRTLIAFLSILLTAFSVAAHEYWLEPESFFLRPGERSDLRLYLGEGLNVEEEMPYLSSKTSIFRLHSSDGPFDLTSEVRDEARPLLSFSALKSGTYLLAMERNWSYITLEPDKFEAYLREDGMQYIIAERQKRGEGEKEGKERYSRFLKVLIQVGDKRDKTFSQRGLRLDIVPLRNPYSLKVGDQLSVQVLFEGKPLADKVLFADNREGNSITKQQLTTNADGIAKIDLDRKGVWLVRLVFMQRCTKHCEGADWESFWGALSFGMR
ncbi:MAG: DUF4198 domain-containing protein [Pyrinomonadaceae bacterium]